ncbi:hypothetical protein H8M03_10335 [Sphingomonas sabuli]|uniref:Uncharacterized protein n=1 Tax=Sphingomonas sabuli TaxID=2764186 RepID=A0A7G9L1A2_9SPHN|nr:hypothetical protein [Sphingomonas sabuli]QNM82401.1 hypothetical protein H8M03_10335 [Sphingomonas sabuli]
MQIDLGRVDKTQPHLFADTLEIVCVATGGPVSATDAMGLIATSVAPAEEGLSRDEPDLNDDGVPDEEATSITAERHAIYVEECFRQLEYRGGAFGAAYPFQVDGNLLKLSERYNPLQCLYLFLLYASRTRTFRNTRGLAQELADYFELISRDVLRKLMPSAADVIMFGPNSDDRRKRFHTDLRTALPMLAKFMGMQMAPDWKSEDEAAQGDASIDLVGVQKLDDGQGGWNVFLGQCAAHEKHDSWKKKRAEADLDYHRSRFHTKVRTQSVLFVPGCFRQTNGEWVNKAAADNVILMDRLRILRALQDQDPAVLSSCWFLREKQLNGPAAHAFLDLI